MFDVTRMEHWFWGLLATVISGISQAGLSVLGASSLQAMGVNIPTFTLRQLLLTCGVGGLFAAFTYLKQSPLPNIIEKTTVTTVETKTVEHADSAPPKEKEN